MCELIKVFVYGTLKRGFPNHHYLASPPSGYAKFLTSAYTKERYPLVIATDYHIPFLLSQPGTGKQVIGEVYEVDEEALKHLDEIEQHPTWYQRSLKPVVTLDSVRSEPKGTELLCNIYLLPNFKEYLLGLEQLGEYTQQHSQYLYTCPEDREPDDIVNQVKIQNS